MKKRALLIGVNQYHLLGDLKYALQDAEAVSTSLCRYGGFSDQDITLMTCQSEGACMGLSRYIEHALMHLTDERDLDLLVFGFWGHGFASVAGRRYLCGVDATENDLERTAVSLDVVKAKLAQVGAENTLLLLDCCQNRPTGRATSAEPMTEGEEAALSSMARDIQVAKKQQAAGRISTVAILNACREGQKAYEWESRGHGIFTAHLLDAFEEGFAGIAPMATWLFDRVAKTAWDLHQQAQTPYFMIEGKGDISLSEGALSSSQFREAVSREGALKREIEWEFQEAYRTTLKGEGSKEYLERVWATRLSAWREGADRGWPEAQWLVGRCCEEGFGLDKDLTKAVQMFFRSAEQGNVSAQHSLGLCYEYGEGVTEDETEAVKWYRKAAEQGNAPAQDSLGQCYRLGAGVPKDEAEAVKWHLKAAEQGDALAQCNLGACYERGWGVTEDKAEAVRWYRKAAEKGYGRAQEDLGFCYDYGWGVTEDKTEAVKWYRKAAEQGRDLAQNNLGDCYDSGEGVLEDKEEAVKWYRKAAEQGHYSAQNSLGDCYNYGEGVTEDKTEAVRWYRKAAEQDHDSAQHNLGCCYEHGCGVTQDKAEAVKWYREAAEEGNASAQHKLGVCYENGEGIKKDKKEAIEWYRKSAEQGNKKALEALKRLESKGKCFISTSVSEALGWKKDCSALNALRNLRDTYMQETPERRQEVQEYYRIAPQIVEAVNARPDPKSAWQIIAKRYVLPCVEFVEKGKAPEAHRLYRKMVHELKEEYLTCENQRKRS